MRHLRARRKTAPGPRSPSPSTRALHAKSCPSTSVGTAAGLTAPAAAASGPSAAATAGARPASAAAPAPAPALGPAPPRAATPAGFCCGPACCGATPRVAGCWGSRAAAAAGATRPLCPGSCSCCGSCAASGTHPPVSLYKTGRVQRQSRPAERTCRPAPSHTACRWLAKTCSKQLVWMIKDHNAKEERNAPPLLHPRPRWQSLQLHSALQGAQVPDLIAQETFIRCRYC